MTTHQVRTAVKGADESFKIDGKDVHHVSLLGVVRGFEQKETKFLCTIEDHTGAWHVWFFPPPIHLFIESFNQSSSPDYRHDRAGTLVEWRWWR